MPSGRLLVTDCGRIAGQGGVKHLLEKELQRCPSLRHCPPNWQAPAWHIVLSGGALSCKVSQGGFGASGRLGLHHCALWWQQVYTAATLCCTRWFQGLAEPDTLQTASMHHRILFSPFSTTLSTTQMRKWRPRVSNPGSLTWPPHSEFCL